MRNYGNLRRVFTEDEPKAYDRTTRMVCFDIQAATEVRTEEDDVRTEVEGYSYLKVEIDKVADYGHVKSQLVEAAYPQKAEHAMALNAIAYLLAKDSGEEADESDLEEIQAFLDYRRMCGKAAKMVMSEYK